MKIPRIKYRKKREYRRGLFWCWGCDRQMVNDWIKCPVCGSRNNKRRNRPKDRFYDESSDEMVIVYWILHNVYLFCCK